MHSNNPFPAQSGNDPQSLNDMLQELRILLQGSQLLTAFLIVLPFSDRFHVIIQAEKIVYLITFICALLSLVLFSTPAVHHRLKRPLVDRVRFKNFSSYMMIIGLVPLTVALTLAAQLVVSEVIGEMPGTLIAGGILLFIILIWWVFPFVKRT